VRLTVRRAGKDREVTVRRATVSVPQVASEMTTYEDTKYGVIKLAQFGSGAHAEVYAAIRKVRERGAKGIVFDLRGNGGGSCPRPAHRERLHRRGPDRHDEGPRRPGPHAARHGRPRGQGRPARGARGR
jgi:hypothetical protein